MKQAVSPNEKLPKVQSLIFSKEEYLHRSISLTKFYIMEPGSQGMDEGLPIEMSYCCC